MNPLALLAGDARTFLDKVWASRVHLHHTDPGQLVEVLSLEDVDTLLTGSGLRTPALRVVRDGSVCPAGEFTRAGAIAGEPLTGLVDPHKALRLYDEGATLVLQGLHRSWPPLAELVRQLELALGHPCQANAYLTPPGSQGFARHSDTHDVFVFQTHGHKQWQLVEGDVEREVLLEPGLVMYLPTGTPHSARSQLVASLHVTIGINRLTWRDALRREAERVLADPRYDAPLPAGYLEERERLAEPLAGELARFAGRIRELDAGQDAVSLGDGFLRSRTPLLPGALVDRTLELDDDTPLVRRSTAACLLHERDQRLVVLTGERELTMPARLRPAMEHLRDHERTTPRELGAWLDEPSRLLLCRRLVREGLLRVAR